LDDGCTQAILLAHGFKSQLLAELVRTKLVTVSRTSDALEFPNGRIELLTILCEGQAATMLQLTAQQTITAEEDAQKKHIGSMHESS
jgi:hypothetical protein